MSTISHNMHQHSTYAVVDTRSEKEKVWLILKRLDHLSFQTLKCMFLDALKGFHIDDLVCDVYERAKHERHSYCYDNTEIRKNPFQLIQFDVWGLAPSIDIHGFMRFLIFLDDFS